MLRRFYGFEGAARRGQRGGDGAPIATYQSILGPLLVEMWHSQLGIATVSGNVDTWTGQIGGRVLQAPAAGQRPVYAADGSVFGGKSVVQCAVTGSLCLSTGTIAQLIASGTRPCVVSVHRYRATAGVNPVAFDFYKAGIADVFTSYKTGGAAFGCSINAFGGSQVSGAAIDTARHCESLWPDGTNLVLDLAGSQATAAFSGSLTNNITGVGVGCIGNASSNFSDTSHALLILLSAYPGAAALAAVQALAASEFPP